MSHMMGLVAIELLKCGKGSCEGLKGALRDTTSLFTSCVMVKSLGRR